MRILFLFLISIGTCWAQELDSGYVEKPILKNQIKSILGYYSQDGNHSAVTGGEGTEELVVKSSRIIFIHKTDSNNKWIFKSGLDQITSASTDKINYIESSASYQDHRAQIDIGFDKVDSTRSYGFHIGTSIESDYWSRVIGFKYHQNFKKDVEFKLGISYYWDDLRWGWVKLDQWKGDRLIYPYELRGTKWFDKSHRNSINLSSSLNWISSKRSRMGVKLDLVFQEGILSTPFHRIYFSDGSKGIERFPDLRFKIPVGFSYNYMFSRNVIVKNYARLYWDSFGLFSGTYKIQVPIKIKHWFWIKPFARTYVQNGVDFFHMYGEHESSSDYFTSDYDLSRMSSLSYGVDLKLKKKVNWQYFKESELKVEKFIRSDGLSFWQFVFLTEFKF
jgi:hypothetical protein